MNNTHAFDARFSALTGNEPFPWQRRLYRRLSGMDSGSVPDIPKSCCLPTGLGKTSVIAVWMLALADGAPLPKRMVYVVNRRTVVDQTTNELRKYADAISEKESLSSLRPLFDPLSISTLRGQFADNGQWCENPARPAIICGTVDMIGSRLLFSGYRIGFKSRPLHAAFLSQDAILVHDEAHLEPAFQRLVEQIQDHQSREPVVPWPKLQVMELTATSKSKSPFELNSVSPDSNTNDYKNPIVAKRMNAAKALQLHTLSDEKKPQKELTAKSLEFVTSNTAVLVFATSVESVLDIATGLVKAGVPPENVKTLTGTMRGHERDLLAGDVAKPANKTFARFIPKPPADATSGTVYLICTSAGEVGINISADHLICDLSTYESMAQRFGRVNRFGDKLDSQVHVFYPTQWDETHPLTPARKKTLKLLQSLDGTASPKALGDLPVSEKADAFAPHPEILPATEILFDAWALTTLRQKLPGRPEVESWLHGVVPYELPQTKFAWREEVQFLSAQGIPNEILIELLDAYPLTQRELLSEPSYRAHKHLQLLASRHGDAAAWLVDDFGRVEVLSLKELADKDNKEQIERMTVLLDPLVGGLSEAGLLDGNSESPVSDQSETLDRCRRKDDDDPPDGMHEVFAVVMPDSGDEDMPEVMRWFARRNTGEARSRKPVLLEKHVRDVENRLSEIIENLTLGERLNTCLRLAAKYHDHGKARAVFQTMLGNRSNSGELWAKSGRTGSSLISETYRHEFGSLHELPSAEELQISEDDRDLVMHLIAAHHGRARPCFPRHEIFDPHATDNASEELALKVVQRFGRLQQRYGRWGLAYLESLLRAADWWASANPSSELEART